MNFVADESVDQDVVDSLRKAGHDIVAIAETHPGISDEAVLKLANDHDALLLDRRQGFR